MATEVAVVATVEATAVASAAVAVGATTIITTKEAGEVAAGAATMTGAVAGTITMVELGPAGAVAEVVGEAAATTTIKAGEAAATREVAAAIRETTRAVVEATRVAEAGTVAGAGEAASTTAALGGASAEAGHGTTLVSVTREGQERSLFPERVRQLARGRACARAWLWLTGYLALGGQLSSPPADRVVSRECAILPPCCSERGF